MEFTLYILVKKNEDYNLDCDEKFADRNADSEEKCE